MAFVGSSIVGANKDSTAEVFNIALGAVNTEQSQVLPANTKEFIIRT